MTSTQPGLPAAQSRRAGGRIDARVREIAALLDLETTLSNRAAGLTADGKQKISLGRGLVRKDVSAILFDEPLTVIDPHLKWRLRSKLKELHQRLGTTMIYVTHDQTGRYVCEKVVVMMRPSCSRHAGSCSNGRATPSLATSSARPHEPDPDVENDGKVRCDGPH